MANEEVPPNMRAVVYRRFGPIKEVLKLEEVRCKPSPTCPLSDGFPSHRTTLRRSPKRPKF